MPSRDTAQLPKGKLFRSVRRQLGDQGAAPPLTPWAFQCPHIMEGVGVLVACALDDLRPLEFLAWRFHNTIKTPLVLSQRALCILPGHL